MKTRNLILTIMAGLMLIASPSCQKAELNPENTDENSSVQNPSTEGTIFRASLETPGSPDDANTTMTTSAADTKMTLTPVPGTENQMTPTWEEGDQIKIFYMDPTTSQMVSVTASANAAGTSTDFTTETTIPESVETFYAVHPATLEATVDADGNFVVPISKASPTFTNACISIAKCGADKIFRFKNLCSVLKFTVGTRGNVMKVASIDGSAITGKINASLDADGNVKYAEEPYTNTNNVVEMNLIPAGSVNTECYIPILPGTQAAGVAIDYANVTKLPAVFADFAIPFERSRIYSLGTVDSHLVTDFYITVSGSGDKSGKSWENAGDVNTFKTLVGYMADANKGKKYAQILRTKGTTFHFGAGTYVFGDADNDRLTIDFYGANGSLYSEFTIQGGYPANGGDTTSPTNVTAFSGNDQYGILNVFDRARVHINDVTFANALGTSITAEDTDIHSVNLGAALYMKQKYTATDNKDKAAPRVWLTNCIFKNNTTNPADGANTYIGGSAINLVHGAVYADHCIFLNNSDNKYNGCVKLSGKNNFASHQAYAFFNACLFKGNDLKAPTVNGGVVAHHRKGALLGMFNCTFYENLTTGGNCIHLDKSAIIANCTIVNNCYGQYPLRFRAQTGKNDNQYILANNILIQTDTDVKNSMAINMTTSGNNDGRTFRLYMNGGNLYGNLSSNYFTNTTYTTIDTQNEYAGKKYSDFDNPSFADNVFKWNGTLNNGTITCSYMSEEIMVNEVLKSSDINDSDENVTFSITGNNGETSFAGFYTWLNSIGAINKDATGATRPKTGWTPGAYQASTQAQ